MSENEKKKLLEIKDLKIYYPIKGKRDAEGRPAYVKAVDGVTFDVYENETFGLVGESGCGKSTTGRTGVRLNKPTAGSGTFEGHDLFAKMNRQQNMDLTQKIQIIYQDPYSSLDPRFTVGRCIEEPLIVHHMGNKEERRARVLQLMHDVGLREEVYTRYPHEFAYGAQRAAAPQRIGQPVEIAAGRNQHDRGAGHRPAPKVLPCGITTDTNRYRKRRKRGKQVILSFSLHPEKYFCKYSEIV